MAQYGSYNYESTESRALKSITSDSYNKDQAKNLIQLNNNSAYMAQYLRKLQKGVDSANQNVIQQVQSFVNDILVLVGGGTTTAIDFGDLKYVFQAIGSLFGFDTETGIGSVFPINLFQAAWHFMSTYVVNVDAFTDFLDSFVDTVLAGLIDLLGDIPIVGGAITQLAAVISDVRDGMSIVGDDLQDLIDQIFGFFSLEESSPGSGTTIGDFIAQGQDFVRRLLGIEDNALIALSPTNPVVAAIDGRVSVLESALGSWTDNFNNRTTIGAKYNVISGGSHIAFRNNAIGASGTTGNMRWAALFTDEVFQTAKNYAQWTIKIPFGATGDTVFVSMSDTGMTNFVGVKIQIGVLGIGSGGRIVSGSSPSSITNRGTFFNHQWKTGDTIGIGYDPDSETYVAYVNNTAVDLWNDTGAIVGVSSLNRSAGMICASNDAQGGTDIDEWAAYDWT